MEQQEIDMTLTLAANKVAIESLQRQNEYLLDAVQKFTERFNAMGKLMLDGQKGLEGKFLEALKPLNPKYTLKPTQSELTGELAAAMSKAKSEFGSIEKASTANRGKFASLIGMIEVIAPILNENNLDASFLLGVNEHGEYQMSLKVTHKSNQWFETTALLNEARATQNDFHQKIGAAEKYLRRYMLRSMFNLAEEGE